MFFRGEFVAGCLVLVIGSILLAHVLSFIFANLLYVLGLIAALILFGLIKMKINKVRERHPEELREKFDQKVFRITFASFSALFIIGTIFLCVYDYYR